jgi:polygalacturonase
LREVVFTPEEFGAAGDGRANDWVPIQRALAGCSGVVYNASVNTAPRRSCRVLFSRSYLSGPLIINSSRTTLEVAAGAVLGMLPRPEYEAACPQTGCTFISTGPTPQQPGSGGEGCRTVYPNPHAPSEGYQVCLSDVTLTGAGVIDGGSTWSAGSWWLCGRLDLPCWRPKLTYFGFVERLTVGGGSLTFRRAPTGFLRLHGNVGVRVRGLTLTAPYSTRNTDGINVYGGFDTLMEVRRPLRPFRRPDLTEMYLCDVCSCLRSSIETQRTRVVCCGRQWRRLRLCGAGGRVPAGEAQQCQR